MNFILLEKDYIASAEFLAEQVPHFLDPKLAHTCSEALIIVIREQVVRGKSAKSIRIAQKNPVRYFITSGHWQPGDPTLVSEFITSNSRTEKTERSGQVDRCIGGGSRRYR